MKKLLLAPVLCIIFSIASFAQDKDNKQDRDNDRSGSGRRINVVKLDTIPQVNLPQDYPKPIDIPNAFDGRPLTVKDISVPMPNKMLTGKENVVMPGTEILDKMDYAEYFRNWNIKPVQIPDSVSINVIPKK